MEGLLRGLEGVEGVEERGRGGGGGWGGRYIAGRILVLPRFICSLSGVVQAASGERSAGAEWYQEQRDAKPRDCELIQEDEGIGTCFVRRGKKRSGLPGPGAVTAHLTHVRRPKSKATCAEDELVLVSSR